MYKYLKLKRYRTKSDTDTAISARKNLDNTTLRYN